MLDRLDQHPDPWGQLREIMRHYARAQAKRETARLKDLEVKARGGKDPQAKEELEKALFERAERRGTTLQDELARLKNGNP